MTELTGHGALILKSFKLSSLVIPTSIAISKGKVETSQEQLEDEQIIDIYTAADQFYVKDTAGNVFSALVYEK